MRSIDRLNIESLTQRSQRKLTVRDWMTKYCAIGEFAFNPASI
jgi:hypothetical protein